MSALLGGAALLACAVLHGPNSRQVLFNTSAFSAFSNATGDSRQNSSNTTMTQDSRPEDGSKLPGRSVGEPFPQTPRVPGVWLRARQTQSLGFLGVSPVQETDLFLQPMRRA